MEELPKIVQQRLATATPSEHPDANLLSAFAENLLPNHERTNILRHLTECADCREIIALAQPQEEVKYVAVAMAAAVGAASPILRSAPRRSNFRWGALAACAVIVAGAVWFARRPAEKTVAVLPSGSISAHKPSGQQPQAEPTSDLELQTRLTAQRADEVRALRKPLAKSRDERKLPSKDNVATNVATAGAPVAAPPPSESILEKNQMEAAQLKGLPAAPKPHSQDNSVLARASGPALERDKQLASPEKEEKSKKAAAAAYGRVGETLSETTLTSNLLDTLVRWTLSDGKLRRSDDAGLSWRVVPLDQDVKLRALSVLGDELWVGGKQGVLYHSSDNGLHWVHVIPSSRDEVLSEDIVRLEFNDSEHGKVITPNSEWITANGGATWQRKPAQ